MMEKNNGVRKRPKSVTPIMPAVSRRIQQIRRKKSGNPGLKC
jgi:hypothetical protein